jgi:hypothetical protein
MEERVAIVKKTRTLKDGTIKAYTCKKTYKVKNGVNDLRANGGRPSHLTEEERAAIRQRRADGVSIKRLCEDYKTCYITVTKILNGEAVK